MQNVLGLNILSLLSDDLTTDMAEVAERDREGKSARKRGEATFANSVGWMEGGT